MGRTAVPATSNDVESGERASKGCGSVRMSSSGDGFQVTPADLDRWSDDADVAAREVRAVRGAPGPPVGAFGNVTHSGLIERLATQFAESDVADRLRSSEADAELLADLLRSAAAGYAAQDAESAADVRGTLPDGG